MARRSRRWMAAGLALGLSVAGSAASACSRIPPDSSLGLTAAELEGDAQRLLADATAVVEATVIHAPTRRGPPGATLPRGLLRVDRVLAGNAPATVETRWHACGYFGRVGEQATAVLRSGNVPIYVHPEFAEAIRRVLAARRLGP